MDPSLESYKTFLSLPQQWFDSRLTSCVVMGIAAGPWSIFLRLRSGLFFFLARGLVGSLCVCVVNWPVLPNTVGGPQKAGTAE